MSLPKQAYSYVRFSSEKQSLGDSARRQLAKATAFALENDLTLDSHTYLDLGVSAFNGLNVVDGKLGTFLEAIRLKLIPANVTLLVESLDRLSREEVDVALERFLAMIRTGVTIVTLLDKRVYSTETIRADPTQLLVSILVMTRANEESKTKSQRVKSAIAASIKAGKIAEKLAPGWLSKDLEYQPARGDPPVKWVIDERKAAVLRFIFERGLLEGSPKIVHRLNTGDVGVEWDYIVNRDGLPHVPVFDRAKEWTTGNVAALLKHQGVMGTLRTNSTAREPIPNYYPAVLSLDAFMAVQEAIKSRSRKGARPHKDGQIVNLFSGMSVCHGCGGTMRLTGMSTSTNGSKNAYLQCEVSNVKSPQGCKASRVPYKTVEAALLAAFRSTKDDLAISKLLMFGLGDAPDPTAPLRVKLTDTQSRMRRLIKQLEELDDPNPDMMQRINEHQATIKRLTRQINETPPPASESHHAKHVAGLCNTFSTEGKTQDEITEMRRRYQAVMRRLISRVSYHTDSQHVSITLRDLTTIKYDYQNCDLLLPKPVEIVAHDALAAAHWGVRYEALLQPEQPIRVREAEEAAEFWKAINGENNLLSH